MQYSHQACAARAARNARSKPEWFISQLGVSSVRSGVYGPSDYSDDVMYDLSVNHRRNLMTCRVASAMHHAAIQALLPVVTLSARCTCTVTS